MDVCLFSSQSTAAKGRVIITFPVCIHTLHSLMALFPLYDGFYLHSYNNAITLFTLVTSRMKLHMTAVAEEHFSIIQGLERFS